MIAIARYNSSGQLMTIEIGPELAGVMARLDAVAGETGHEIPIAAAQRLPIDLDLVRDFYARRVDAEADEFCLSFVSAGVTQSMRYQEKVAEAKAWAPGLDPDDFPFLKLEALETNQTIDAVVTSVLTKAAEWRSIGSKVESKRIGAKAAIAASGDVPSISAAAQIDWLAAIA